MRPVRKNHEQHLGVEKHDPSKYCAMPRKTSRVPQLVGGNRIVVFAAERVGLACVQALMKSGANLVGVITAHDGLMDQIADWVTFDELATAHGLPLLKIRNCRRPEVAEKVAELKPDLICVVSWSMIIPPEILALAGQGAVGIHYSLLPARRGGAPLNWALIDGLTESGITLYYLDEGVDTGDIIASLAFQIEAGDNAKTLLDKIVVLAPRLLLEYIDGILAGSAPRRKQDDSQASTTPRRRPEDGLIDWSRSPQELYNFIRALSPPYPGAFTFVGERKLVIPGAKLVDGRLHLQAYLE